MRILNTYNNYNNSEISVRRHISSSSHPTFQAQPSNQSKIFEPVKKIMSPYSKLMDKMKTQIARGLAKILETKTVENIIRKTRKANMVAHLSALTGVVLSGFYMKKTLENDKLDVDKKMTLAINQGVVCVLSTIAAYTVDGLTNKKINKFTDKYWAAHINEPMEKLYHYKNGIDAAKKIMIFGLIYRFIAPVFATPIANHLGNKLETNRKAKLAAAQKQTNS